jgi:hypothetical protein
VFLGILMSAVALVPATSAPPIVSTSAVASARRYASSRQGAISFSVIEDETALRGLDQTTTYLSASVIKAMVMVAVLQRQSSNALLEPMITASDNAAAIALWNQVGAQALRDVAKRAGMKRFEIGAHLFEARIDTADQARFFLRIDKLVPKSRRAYARKLLAGIVSWQRWGIAPAAKRHGFSIRFKGGWRTGLQHQVASLERDGRRLAIAVLTYDQPSAEYGQETIEGIAERLLSRAETGSG